MDIQQIRLEALKFADDGMRNINEMIATADKVIAFIEGRQPANIVNACKPSSIDLQNKEFEAVDRLATEWRRLQMTPVVDDDYSEVRYRYESALTEFVEALCDNQRFMAPSRLSSVLSKKQVKVPT